MVEREKLTEKKQERTEVNEYMSLRRWDGLGSKAQVEWLTLDERREQDVTGEKKLKVGGDEGWSGIWKLLSDGFHFSVRRQSHLRMRGY